jgi:hypothetical protein
MRQAAWPHPTAGATLCDGRRLSADDQHDRREVPHAGRSRRRRHDRRLLCLTSIDLLVIDDLGLRPLSGRSRPALWRCAAGQRRHGPAAAAVTRRSPQQGVHSCRVSACWSRGSRVSVSSRASGVLAGANCARAGAATSARPGASTARPGAFTARPGAVTARPGAGTTCRRFRRCGWMPDAGPPQGLLVRPGLFQSI